MKTTAIANEPAASPSFQTTVLPKDFALISISEIGPMAGRTPFADLMLHPEKLEAALKIARRQNDDFEASRQQK